MLTSGRAGTHSDNEVSRNAGMALPFCPIHFLPECLYTSGAVEAAMRNGLYPEIEDQELVLMALLGDLEAFDELVRRFRGAVLVVAEQALGSREAAGGA